MAAQAGLSFGGLLRRLREEAGLTQDELAEAARVSQRAVSDLERGINRTARKDTAVLLAGALSLDGRERELFVAAARGKAPAAEALAARGGQAGGIAAVTRGLPRDITSFTGRRSELDRLAGAAGNGGVVGIHAIGGMAGVGKTTFAVHTAHRLAGRFPDGQFFLPLHAHTPGQRPVSPADALASLLLTAGVAAAAIPPGTEARAARWRDQVAGKKILLVLDDAASSEQVRPLLPGAGGSLVLVTSRRHLSALEDATAISLDTLPPGEAAGLLIRLAGRPGLSPADPAVAGVVRLCGYLPLAIGMVGRQLHHHPSWSVAGRAAELAAAVDRLELMATENLSVAAAFNLSYEDLTQEQQRLFRRLGLHPGPDIDAYAAAALDGTGLAAARRGLEALYDQYLLTEPAHGRYRPHLGDMRRMTGDYPGSVPVLEEALAIYRDLGDRPGQANALLPLGYVRRMTGDYQAAARDLEQALGISRDLGDRAVQATALQLLGDLRRMTGDYPGAARYLEEALGIHRAIGHRANQANILTHLGSVRRMTGDYPGAAEALGEALRIYRHIGDQGGEVEALNEAGTLHRTCGDLGQAGSCHEQALNLARQIGGAWDEAHALAGLGRCALAADRTVEAKDMLQQALQIFECIGAADGAGICAELEALAGAPPTPHGS